MPEELAHAEQFYRPFVARALADPRLTDGARQALAEMLDPAKVPAHELPALLALGGKASASPTGRARSPKIKVRVEEGRWIVDCPYCPSAQMAEKDDPRFFCAECHNAEAGGKSLPLKWPDDAAEIEEKLLRRPSPLIRHWNADESVAQLQLENVSLGVAAAGER